MFVYMSQLVIGLFLLVLHKMPAARIIYTCIVNTEYAAVIGSPIGTILQCNKCTSNAF